MVFSNLQEREKDAFFSLLDDYFQSRPEIFAALSGQRSNAGDSNNSATSNAKSLSGAAPTIGQRLFSASPAATFGSGPSLKPRVGNIGGGGGGFSGSAGLGGRGSSATSLAEAASQEEDLQPVAGRVAAAAAAFSQHRLSTPSGSSPSPPLPGGAGSTQNRLSGVDTSSLRNVLAGRTSQSGPPPAYNKASTAAPPPVARRGPPQPEPEPEPEEEEELHGEWAEVLYDYASGEPGDLNIRENQQILVTEKNSDDWWTGEVDGHSGLFPSSYVKLL